MVTQISCHRTRVQKSVKKYKNIKHTYLEHKLNPSPHTYNKEILKKSSKICINKSVIGQV